jgi:CheY-like chemotaxis protein
MRKILTIDDEAIVCQMVKKILESTREYEVTVCTKSADALSLAKRLQPDVILLDLNMPGLSGTELAQQLMSSPATKDIPFIYLTAMVVRQEVEEADHMIGGHYFAAKPVRKPELLRAINLVLRAREDAGAAQEARPRKPTVQVAKLLGCLLKVEEVSSGYFQMSIMGLKSLKGNPTFSSLKEAQEAAHALVHYHAQKRKECTCSQPLEWKEADK